jgi:ATP-dependent Clp protease ATP-binding subunit ClpB
MFDPLTTDDLCQIVSIQLARLNQRLADRRISVEVSDGGKNWLAMAGFDPVYGARPLKRLVQTTIEDVLAKRVLSGEVNDGDTIQFDTNEDLSGLITA